MARPHGFEPCSEDSLFSLFRLPPEDNLNFRQKNPFLDHLSLGSPGTAGNTRSISRERVSPALS
jgi:hypothetical protein